jgi:hypothetical protein
MTFRSSDRARERALAELTREAAETPMPELDWARIESRVLGACDIAPPSSKASAQKAAPPRRPSWVSSPWPIALAAAAVATLIYGTAEMRAPRAPSGGSAQLTLPSPPAGEFSSLAVGEVAETGGAAAVYDRPGPVRLTLAPNSRSVVVANDFREGPRGGITLALARGSIHAAVTQHSDGEIFAVEVEQTRVAAHGTAYSVTREANRLVVDVAEGTVAIGPVGHRGATHGWLLTAPARAAFSLDGARQATWLEATPPVAVGSVREPTAVPALPVAQGSNARPPRPALPTTRGEPASIAKNEESADSAERNAPTWGYGVSASGGDASDRETAAIATILRQLESCYEKQIGAGAVQFSVESSLLLTLTPSGAIREGVFTPPLSPTLMTCADKAIGAAHFPSGDGERRVRIPVHLARAGH